MVNGLKNLWGLYSERVLRLPLAIFYPTQRCNLRCTTCSDWLIKTDPEELTLEEVAGLADDFRGLGVQRVVLSGGEPLHRADLPEVARAFTAQGMKLTLLTNGVYLRKRLEEIRGLFDEVIVSVDGAAAETHDAIRGVRSFDLILEGIESLKALEPSVRVRTRTVVQRRNYRELPDIARLGRRLGVEKVSFLPVDVDSSAFGRDRTEALIDKAWHLLEPAEIEELRELLLRLDRGLLSVIAEPLPKLLRMADYFQAMIGQGPLPEVACNAPMTSLVVDSRGNVLPCYFLPRAANIRDMPLREIVNCTALRETRRLRRRDELDKCRTCVCSLKVAPRAALANRF